MFLILLEGCWREPPSLLTNSLREVETASFVSIADFQRAAAGILEFRRSEGDCLAGRESPWFEGRELGNPEQENSERGTVRES